MAGGGQDGKEAKEPCLKACTLQIILYFSLILGAGLGRFGN